MAEKLAREPGIAIYREIALRFLQNHPDAKQPIAVPLITALLENSEDPNILDFLDSYGKRRLLEGDQETGLNFLAAVWRYRPHNTWQWITTHFLSGVDDRSTRFELWINLLNNIHGSSSDSWPAWVTPEALIDLLPDFFLYFPVSEDPTVDQFNHGGAEIKHRDHLARFRSDAISIVANSGIPMAREVLSSMIKDPEYRNSRDSLLIHLDRWERAQAENFWNPLLPYELLEVLTKGKRPLRNHQELFELVLEIVGDIKVEMEGGQGNLKRLCWIHPTEKGVKPTPADETNLQIVLGREISNHPLCKNIVGNREVTVTGENHPDLKVETILESGQPAIVYIEVKRQMHPKVLTALETQLANKEVDPRNRTVV